MKFAHLADCHIGGNWRDPKLSSASIAAFIKTIDLCIEKKVDFVLIAGDLFNTSLPQIDKIRIVAKKLRELNRNEIPVYVIAGSHDFSPSGKTMLDVLEDAGLFVNVARGSVKDDKLCLDFTVDKKTGVKITGMLGKKGGLEKYYYKNLDRESLEKETGHKIFMFHSAIAELKPEDLQQMDAEPVSMLPKGFNYYAGGHVHVIDHANLEGYRNIVYPGPVFPNNFPEMEKLGHGGFYIIEDGKAEYQEVNLHPTEHIIIDCNDKNVEEVGRDILDEIKKKNLEDAIVTIRLFGCLRTGKPTDIDFKEIFNKLYEKKAFCVLKNTYKLSSKEFEEIKVETSSVEEIENKLIDEHAGQLNVFDVRREKELTKELMNILSLEKDEGEKVSDFEKRIVEQVEKMV